MSQRGKTNFYQWGDTQKTITELLQDPKIYNYVGENNYASKREAIRKLLREGKLTPGIIANAPSSSLPQTERYGSQRRRANLPVKNTRGEKMPVPRLAHDEQYDGPFDPSESPPRYGAQRRHLPLRNSKGQIIEGPRQQKKRPTKKINRQPRTYLFFNGKRTSARKALERFPKLRKCLYWGRNLKQGTLR